MCSAVFVGGLDPDMLYREAVQPVIAPAGLPMDYRIDRGKKAVTAGLAGVVTSRSVFLGEEGCRGALGAAAPAAIDDPPAGANRTARMLAVDPPNPALEAALDRTFAEPETGPPRWTKSAVILHDGHIVAERYAPGYAPETQQIGWSITKSVTNALVRILVRQNKLAVDMSVPVAAWRDPKDPRHAITIDNLLRMNSGIEFGQSLSADWRSAFDPSSQMEFDVADQAAFAETAGLSAAPGKRWNYTNANTMLLARMIRDHAGGKTASVLRFARRELFDKLGMAHVTLEFDSAGTPIGSSHIVGLGALRPALSRRWRGRRQTHPARGLGVLFSPAHARQRNLWLRCRLLDQSRHDWRGRQAHRARHAPDSFMARGSQGQYVMIVPSARLVIVRLGMAHDFYEGIDAVARFVAEAIAALRNR